MTHNRKPPDDDEISQEGESQQERIEITVPPEAPLPAPASEGEIEFVRYLQGDVVDARLKRNVEDFLKNPEQIGKIARMLNDLGQDYLGVAPLLGPLDEVKTIIRNALNQAVENRNLDGNSTNAQAAAIVTQGGFQAWIDFVLAKALNDLFDENGYLRRGVYDALNHNGALQNHLLNNDLVPHNTPNGYHMIVSEKAKIMLLSGYITNILATEADKVFLSNAEDNVQHDMIDPAIAASSVYANFSYCLNRCTQFIETAGRIDENLIFDINQRLSAASENKRLNAPQLKQAIANFQYQQAREKLMHTINNPAIDYDVRNMALHVLTEADKLKAEKKPSVTTPQLTRVLTSTTDLITAPSPEKIKKYTDQAGKFQKLSKGRIFGACMLGLAGAIVVGLCVGLAVISFGAGAPISIAGAAIGASMVLGSVSVVTGTLALGGAFGVGFWAGKLTTKQPLRRASEQLAEDVEKSQKRSRI